VDGIESQRVWRIAEDVIEREGLLGVILVPIPGDAVNGRFFAKNAYLRPLSRLARRPLGPLRRQFLRPVALTAMAGRGLAGLAKPASAVGIHAHIEQPPRRENRVTLSRQVDALGQRRAHVEWRLGDQERDSLLRTLKLFDAALRASNAGKLSGLPDEADFDLLVEQSHHHMGTTRMHASPEHGVVDADCRVHGVPNLYVAGSSVMPTGGAATVTITAVALALRLGDHLRKLL
jgi:choline dehydrogenase-like flavoprotein